MTIQSHRFVNYVQLADFSQACKEEPSGIAEAEYLYRPDTIIGLKTFQLSYQHCQNTESFSIILERK